MKSDLELKSTLDWAYDRAFGLDADCAAVAVAHHAAELAREKAYNIAYAEFKATYRAEYDAAEAAWAERLAKNIQSSVDKS
jgi:hypothetical protein